MSAEADPPAPTRTLGFLFSDLRGYTHLIDQHGDAAAAEVVRAYRRLAREAIERFGGTEVGTEGDSFFVVFESVAGAVRCGIEILRTTGTNDPPIRVGVGVHAGEAVSGELGYVTGSVNLAARLCAQARAGQMLVSDTVRALTRTAVEVRFDSAGAKRLKGFEEPVQVWRVDVPGAARAPEDGLPSRGLFILMLASLLPAAVQVGPLMYFLINNTPLLGFSVDRTVPPSLHPLLVGYGVLYVASDLVLLMAVGRRWPGTARLAARVLVLNIVVTAVLIPVFSFEVLIATPTGAAGAFLIVFAVLTIVDFAATCFGLYRRRPWVVGVAYTACAIFAASFAALPLAIAAAWAIRERREGALY